MNTVCLITGLVSALLTLLLAAALFDIVTMPPLCHGIVGVVDVLSFGLFLKSYIRTRKYTHRD